jgi:K+-sensing histidine kinase KdpD
MNEERQMSAQPKLESSARIPAEINTRLRALAHDLSNSLETIMQASYLLAQMKLDQNTKKWADLIDQASRDAARINREIREILRASA